MIWEIYPNLLSLVKSRRLGFGANCALFVLKPTSFQPTQAYSSQSSDFVQTLAGAGLSEPE